MIFNINKPLTYSSDSSAIKKKTLTFNGSGAIDYISCYRYYEDATYSDENRLLVNISGTVNLTNGHSKYIVDKHQMAFLKKSTLFEYQTIGDVEGKHKAEFFIFNLGYDLVKEFSIITQLIPLSKTDTNSIVISNVHSNFLKFTNSLSTYLEDGREVDDTLVKIKLLELLYSLKNNHSGLLDLFLDLKKEMRPNITIIVEENFMNPLSINQLARLAGRSLSSFRRDFVSVYNTTPSQWIRERRLKKSREFLLNTNMTITDICYTLGFENIAHFSRLFKSQFGHSPTEYRLQLLSA